MRRSVLGLLAAASLLAAPAGAAEDDEADPSILDGVPAFAGLAAGRDALAEQGFRISGFYFSDPRGNLSGGLDKGWTYSGLFKIGVDVDAKTVFGIEGGRLHADMLQIHGRDVSEEHVGNLLSANDIGARPTTRLFELYWDQEVSDRLSVRLGQMAADEEFMTSAYGENFLDATFGWAGPPSENLPQGGPAYPLAALGAQATWKATENFTLVGAVYNGRAAPGRYDDDPERGNRHGLNFRLQDAPMVILEGRYRYNEGEDAAGLPGEIKFGGYGHFGRFGHLKRGTDGLVLGSPGSNDDPRRRRGNVNLFAIVDQQIWRLPGGEDEQGIGVFARVIAGSSDRNPISTYVDGGVVARGLVPGRPNDVIGVAYGWADFSPALADADRAAHAAAGLDLPARSSEAVLEATYRAQIVPGLTVQPTFQYVWRPSGGFAEAESEDEAPKRTRNAKVFGVATIVRF
ncbi:carbohydrate porin [Hansschlegelia sp. KR7-227]|uniref:carbohydrate porin n=1 Tax=Hansschlegelia sp. KR7-227 TaxID=3400914 RepID=UPI003BFF7E5A